MNFPTITQYLETLNHVDGLFRTLGDIVPERDLYGELVFQVGNFAAIFRVRRGECLYALKCYIREPNLNSDLAAFLADPPSFYIVPSRWIPDEVYVYDEHGNGRYYPVMWMEWIEGETLGRHTARLTQRSDCRGLAALAARFDRLALWLLDQPFAHGDIKHDNILVTPSGELRLIDFDGMFLPSFAGRRTPLLGSPAYQHPARDEYYFDKSIDDYPLAVVSLSLHALVRDPSLFAKYNDRENLIFNAAELASGTSGLLTELEREWEREEFTVLPALSRMLRGSTPSLRDLPRVLKQLSQDMAELQTVAQKFEGAMAGKKLC